MSSPREINYLKGFIGVIFKFPWWSFIYSGVLTLLAWGSLALYKKYDGDIPTNASDSMYVYITLIIAWLVTTRPVYALSVHDKLTDQLHEIMESFKDEDFLDSEELQSLFIYIVTNLSSHPKKHLPALYSSFNKMEMKSSKKIIKIFHAMKMRQRLAVPQSLHGMCVLLTIIFHSAFAPILFYGHGLSVLGTLIANFILAIYTTGCLEVAISLENPYRDVTIQSSTPAITEFHRDYTEIMQKNIETLTCETLYQHNRTTLMVYLEDVYDFKVPIVLSPKITRDQKESFDTTFVFMANF